MSHIPIELPARFRPHVVVRPEAPEAYVECGQRYWAWSGVRIPSTTGSGSALSVWAETTKVIAKDLGEPAGRLYLIAAAGVEATLPDIECGTCRQPVTLASRTGLDELIRSDGSRGPCARCDSRIQAEVAKLLDPDLTAARIERRRVVLKNQSAREAALEARRIAVVATQQLQSERRAAVEERHPVEFTSPEEVVWDDVRSRFETELGVLAVLDYAPGTSPIPPTGGWESQLCPDASMAVSALSAAFHAGLLRVHPTSRLEGFVWAGEKSSELTDSFYPMDVSWYVGLGPSMGVAADTLQAWVAERCRRWLATEVGVESALKVVRGVVVAETLRYLDDQLFIHNLPEVPDNHRARLLDAAQRLAHGHTLGQGYSIAWRAARNAATMAQRHPYAPAINATAHAVNTFEGMVLNATSAPSAVVPIYREDRRTPLTALTRTLFVRVLDVDPMGSSAPMIEDALRSMPGFPQHSGDLTGGISGPRSGAEAVSAADAQETLQMELGRRLRDAVTKLTVARVPTAVEWETFLEAVPGEIANAYELNEAGTMSVADGVTRIRAYKALLQDSSMDMDWVHAVAVAHLLPGVLMNVRAEEFVLGEVLGGAFIEFVRSLDGASG